MVNSKLFAQKPVDDGGTPESTWREWGRSFPELDLTGCSRLIIVAPHPDDEILGLGGTALLAILSGISVQVVSVTDGGASHPDSPTVTQPEMERRRRSESDRAARVLGIPTPVRLSIPDGKIGENRQELTDRLSSILGDSSADTWCASTWRGDGHPDHEATGDAAARACADTGSRLIEYPIWAWHWAAPDHAAVPWERARKVTLPSDVQAAKSAATNEFTSQIAPLFRSSRGCTHPPPPRDGTITEAVRDGVRMSDRELPADYFAKMYAAQSDPWDFESRWYEQRKYALSVAMLPKPRYRRAFEPGCSIGVLTEKLSERCDSVLATDIVPTALESARERLTGHDAEFRLWALGDDWPDETFDLVVISEVGYYLTFEKLIEAMLQVVEHLEPGGTLLCAHWRHVVPEYPQNGDAVHSAVRQTPGLAQFASYQDEDVLIDVFVKGPPSPPSVARSEGLI